jgi:type IV pilus assembly protein PilV
MSAAKNFCPATQRGVSLLEVMIAALVLAVGVLGAASLQLNAIRYNASAAHATQASFIAYDILDRMRVNAANLAGYAVVSAPSTCTANPGTGTTIAARDRADFIAAVTCQLPAGTASVTISDNVVEIRIGWSEARTRAGEANTEFLLTSLVTRFPL